jgi:cold shock CspA family protein
MSANDGTRRRGEERQASKPVAANTGGRRFTGRIVKMLVGQSHGFIRLPNEQDVYFHRADSPDCVAFYDLRVGDAVTFELIEDTVSGARALGVVKRSSST